MKRICCEGKYIFPSEIPMFLCTLVLCLTSSVLIFSFQRTGKGGYRPYPLEENNRSKRITRPHNATPIVQSVIGKSFSGPWNCRTHTLFTRPKNYSKRIMSKWCDCDFSIPRRYTKVEVWILSQISWPLMQYVLSYVYQTQTYPFIFTHIYKCYVTAYVYINLE